MSDDLNTKAQIEFKLVSDLDKGVTQLRKITEAAEEFISTNNKVDESLKREAAAARKALDAIDAKAKGTQRATATAQAATTATSASAKANDDATRGIIAQRYALYDVATTYGVISAALLGMSAYAVKTGADFESAFTSVERTSEGSVNQIEGLRAALVDLSTQMPLTFAQLSNVAALGNQLGIDPSNIESFTETIARFAAISGLSAESVAESFGKLSNLTGLDPSQFENLGSAIAYVARSSAATEASILSTSKEIAAIATGAGMSAESIVGLSGALASLAIAPEKARGALSIYFSTLDSAVAEGGDKLANFATVVGVTSDELDRMVRNGEGQQVLQGFLAGLSDLDNVAKTTALDKLGLSAVRVDQTFKALSGNTKLVTESFAQSQSAMGAGTELARQYALVVDDLASEWMMFVNSINALVEAISGGAVPGLAALVGGLTDAVNGVRAFVETDFGGWLARTVLIIGTVGGAMIGLRSMTALATASVYALITAQRGLAATGTVGGIGALIGAMKTYTGAATVATVATRLLGSALKAIGIGLALGLLFDFGGTMQWVADGVVGFVSGVYGMTRAFLDFTQSVSGLLGPLQVIPNALASIFNIMAYVPTAGAKGFQSWAKGLGSAADSASDYTSALDGMAPVVKSGAEANDALGTSLDGVGGSAAGAAAEIRTLVDYASDLSGVFARAFEIRFSGDQGLDSITSGWSAIRSAIAETNSQIDEYRATMMSLTADKAIKEYWLSVAENYGDVLRAGELRAELATIDSDLKKESDKLTKAQDKNTKTLGGNTDGAIENRAEILGLVGNYQSYIAALASSGMSQADLATKTAQLKQEFIAQATQLGYSQVEIAKYASAFDDVTIAINAVPRNITVTANVNPALQALNEFMAAARSAASGGINVPIHTTGGADKGSRDALFTQWATAAQKQYGVALAQNATGWAIVRANWERGAYAGYESGGYTGNGGTSNVAGVVHGKEFVFSAPAVKNIGVDNLAFMHNMAKRGKSGSGSSGSSSTSSGVSTTQLSAFDRQLLMDIRDRVGITIPGAVFPALANAGNSSTSHRRTS